MALKPSLWAPQTFPVIKVWEILTMADSKGRPAWRVRMDIGRGATKDDLKLIMKVKVVQEIFVTFYAE